MESTNLHEGLIGPPAASSPSRTAASGSDDKKSRGSPPVDSGKAVMDASNGDDGSSGPASPSRGVDGPGSYSPPTDNGEAVKNQLDADETSTDTDTTPHRLPPPPPSGAGDGTGTSYSPAVDNSKHPAASFSSPPAATDGDGTKPPSTSTTPLPVVLGSNATSTSRGQQGSPFPTLPAPSRRWWSWGQGPLGLPVVAPAPPPGRRFNGFHLWRETNRPRAPRLDSVGVEKVIGIFGFSLFGAISLLPSTMDRVQQLSDGWKIPVMLIFGITFVASSVGVLCGLHGKSDFEQAVCRHTGRIGMLGLASLVLLHVRWALPDGIVYDVVFWVLLFLAVLLHFGSWVASYVVGEDRIVVAAPADAEQ